MSANRRACARASKSARHKPPQRKPTRWNRWPEDAWTAVDQAFWCQAPEAILAILFHDPVDPEKVAASREKHQADKRYAQAFPDAPPLPERPWPVAPHLIVHGVRKMYRDVAGKYEEIRAAWRTQLPRRRGKDDIEHAREEAEPKLLAALRSAFPSMDKRELERIVVGTARRDRDEVTDALQKYVGQHLRPAWSSSRVRHAVARAGHLGPHGLDAESEQGLERFLRWIAEARPELRDDVAAWLDGILIARSAGAAPSESFYREYGPNVFALAQAFRREPKPDPRQQLRVAAVEAFGRNDEQAAFELWNRSLIDTPAADPPKRLPLGPFMRAARDLRGAGPPL